MSWVIPWVSLGERGAWGARDGKGYVATLILTPPPHVPSSWYRSKNPYFMVLLGMVVVCY